MDNDKLTAAVVNALNAERAARKWEIEQMSSKLTDVRTEVTELRQRAEDQHAATVKRLTSQITDLRTECMQLRSALEAHMAASAKFEENVAERLDALRARQDEARADLDTRFALSADRQDVARANHEEMRSQLEDISDRQRSRENFARIAADGYDKLSSSVDRLLTVVGVLCNGQHELFARLASHALREDGEPWHEHLYQMRQKLGAD